MGRVQRKTLEELQKARRTLAFKLLNFFSVSFFNLFLFFVYFLAGVTIFGWHNKSSVNVGKHPLRLLTGAVTGTTSLAVTSCSTLTVKLLLNCFSFEKTSIRLWLSYRASHWVVFRLGEANVTHEE